MFVKGEIIKTDIRTNSSGNLNKIGKNKIKDNIPARSSKSIFNTFLDNIRLNRRDIPIARRIDEAIPNANNNTNITINIGEDPFISSINEGIIVEINKNKKIEMKNILSLNRAFLIMSI